MLHPVYSCAEISYAMPLTCIVSMLLCASQVSKLNFNYTKGQEPSFHACVSQEEHAEGHILDDLTIMEKNRLAKARNSAPVLGE